MAFDRQFSLMFDPGSRQLVNHNLSLQSQQNDTRVNLSETYLNLRIYGCRVLLYFYASLFRYYKQVICYCCCERTDEQYLCQIRRGCNSGELWHTIRIGFDFKPIDFLIWTQFVYFIANIIRLFYSKYQFK